MTSRTLHAVLIQHADHGSPADNLAYIERQITEVAGQGAELIVLQELHNTAYFCQVEDVAAFDLAESIPGPTTERLGTLAKRLGVVIVASLFERRAPGLHHNTAVVIERDGSLAGRYRKMHIPDDPGYHEKFYFAPGDLGFHPIETSVGRLGVLVCWDQWYPEAARLMALAGAELLLFPTAIGWDAHDDSDEQQRQLDAWLTVQRAHAIANGLPLLSCNRSGRELTVTGGPDGIDFWGHSFACGPQGEWLARAGAATETLNVHIAMDRSEQVRRIWPFLRDRRIDAFADLQKRYRDDC